MENIDDTHPNPHDQSNNDQTENQDQDENQPFEQEQPQQPITYTHDEKMKACLMILRKFPVSNYKKVVEGITSIIYDNDDLLNDFLQKIDQPSEVSKADKTGEYLLCEYNREGDSYRSNNSNKYFPAPEEGDELHYPSEEIREMEVQINRMFREYTKLYFGGNAVTSCFVWQLSDNVKEGICVAVVIKNLIDAQKGIKGGCWDSSHLVAVSFEGLEAKYKVTSTIFFTAALNHKLGEIEFSGSITRLAETSRKVSKYLDIQAHVQAIGEVIEDVETELRSKIEERNIKKSKEIIDSSRFSPVIGKPNIEGAAKLKGVFMGGK